RLRPVRRPCFPAAQRPTRRFPAPPETPSSYLRMVLTRPLSARLRGSSGTDQIRAGAGRKRWGPGVASFRIVAAKPQRGGGTMSVIDELVHNAEAYSDSFESGELQLPPAKRVAVVACMDARLNPYGLLGLHEGDAHVIRNAGGVITDDEIR